MRTPLAVSLQTRASSALFGEQIGIWHFRAAEQSYTPPVLLRSLWVLLSM